MGILFFVPLFFVPLAYNQFELQKLIILRASIEALFAIYILWTISQKRPIVKWGVLSRSVVGFLAVMYLASLLGVDFGQSFLGNYWRGQGFFTLLHYFMFYVVVSSYGDYGLREKDLFMPLVLAGTAASFMGVLQFFQYNFVLTGVDLLNFRYHVVFGNPNFFGAFLALVAPIAVWNYIKSKNICWLIEIFTILFGLFLSGSRGALLAAVLGAGMFFVKNIKVNKYLIIISAILFTVIGLFFYSNNRTSIYENRGQIWGSAIKAFFAQPILGYGMENFDTIFKERSVGSPMEFIYVDKVHNEILETAVAGGIIGLIFYLSILFIFFNRVYILFKEGNENALLITGVFAAFLVVSLTNVLSVTAYLVFWTLLSIVNFQDGKILVFKVSKLAGVATLILMLVLIIFNFRYMMADIEFAKGTGRAYGIFPFERIYIPYETK